MGGGGVCVVSSDFAFLYQCRVYFGPGRVPFSLFSLVFNLLSGMEQTIVRLDTRLSLLNRACLAGKFSLDDIHLQSLCNGFC